MEKRLSQVRSTLSLMSQRKGTHIGVVLSFVIFMTFIIFLYIIVQPAIKLDDKQNFLEYIEGEIIGKSSTDLTSVSVAVDKTNPKTCIQFLDFFNKTEIGNRIIARNDAGNVLQTRISGDGKNLFIVKSEEDDFIKVHESNEFDIAETGVINPCQQLSEGKGGYNLGLIKTNKQIFETKIIKLMNDYNNNYETLKEELGVAPGSEFGFSFTYSDGIIIKTGEKNISVSVYVNEIPIQYISKDAAREPGFLNIKAW